MQRDVCLIENNKVCAGIVLYNADIDRLIQNIDSIVKQVDKLILVDNGSANISQIEKNLASKLAEDGIELFKSDINMGIAWALNVIHKYARENSYDWFITLDQDSVCADGLVEKYVKNITPQIGQITCDIRDRNLGELDRAEYNGDDVKEIEHCITSGCINNTNAIFECGGYDESLFIDGVDLDISCNLRKHGYKVIQIKYEGLLHELGDGSKKNIFGKEISIAHHLPWRNYYTRRNLIYVARKYYKGTRKFKLVAKQIIYAIGIVLLEDKKIERIQKNVRGIYDGFKMPVVK